MIMLSHVLSIVTKLNLFMQTSNEDFTRLPGFLSNIYEELTSAKDEDSAWIEKSKEVMTSLREEYGITIADKFGFTSTVNSAEQYSEKVAAPYMSKLISNIKKRFSDETVSLLVASSVFNLSKLPPMDRVRGYGEEQIGVLTSFYGEDAKIEFQGSQFVSKALICKQILLEEWQMFAKAMVQEKKKLVKETPNLSMSQLASAMFGCDAYRSIFAELFKLLEIILSLPVSTATVEGSFSKMKLIKTRLRSRLTDDNLKRLMRISIKGPDLKDAKFEEVLDIFKKSNRRILL